MDFTSVCNAREGEVFTAVADQAAHYPMVGQDEQLLADVACVALNRLPARYIRHHADLSFYATEAQRDQSRRAVHEAVEYAFGYVQARHVMAVRR